MGMLDSQVSRFAASCMPDAPHAGARLSAPQNRFGRNSRGRAWLHGCAEISCRVTVIRRRRRRRRLPCLIAMSDRDESL